MSRAGDETWFRVHPPGAAFDAGRGSMAMAGVRDVFLTHGHLDHALGVPFVLSQRRLQGNAATRVFCPAAIRPALAALVNAASRLEEVPYRCEVAGLDPGERVEVGRDLAVEAFASDHVVPSLGYHLVRSKRRLRERFAGLEPAEVARLKRAGETVERTVEEIAFSYCGDTGPGVFELEPRVFESAVLLLECTFLDSDRRARSERYGHVHFEDLAERAGEFRNRALVLHHLSRRHRPRELRALVDSRLPALAPRVFVWGARAAA